jgi:hypothetical protein
LFRRANRTNVILAEADIYWRSKHALLVGWISGQAPNEEIRSIISCRINNFCDEIAKSPCSRNATEEAGCPGVFRILLEPY